MVWLPSVEYMSPWGVGETWVAELAHPTSFWALCNVCLGPRSLQEIPVVVKEALALCLTYEESGSGQV